jgi:hypothetical protein
MAISNSQNPEAIVVPQPLRRIDWAKFRRQKKWVLRRVETAPTSYEKGAALGILNLMDNIQEYAVEELNLPREVIWGPEAVDEAA